MIFQQMKPGTGVLPHFYVILTGQSVSCIIFYYSRSSSRSNKQKYHIQQIKLGTCVIPLFLEILSETSISVNGILSESPFVLLFC